MAVQQGHPRIAIIGGGIAGLAAAYHLRELAAVHETPLEVTVFEASARLGGALETISHGEFTVETGADSFLAEKPWAIRLAERLGLAGQIVRTQERFRQTLVVHEGRLMPIPEGFSLMAPAYLGPVLRSPLFSAAGKLRITMEPLIPRRRTTADESLAAFIQRRMGREVLTRVGQPLAAGIYTADPAKLSAEATMPRFVEMERRHGSLIRGLRAAARARSAEARGTSGARWSLFVSFAQGMGVLVEALAARLDVAPRLNTKVVAASHADTGWRLELADGAKVEANAIIGAAPAYGIAPIIRPYAERLATTLKQISYASAATVNLAFRATDFPHLPASFGFVVPAIERRKIIAGSFSSLKFAGRAPEDTVLARVFIGGALQTAMMTLDDTAMVAAAREEFAALLGVESKPLFSLVRRWPESMPQYAVGHRDRVTTIHERAAKIPNFFLAGAYLDGVGIPDCVRSGEAAADAAFAAVGRR